jgi:hypothetical protein
MKMFPPLLNNRKNIVVRTRSFQVLVHQRSYSRPNEVSSDQKYEPKEHSGAWRTIISHLFCICGNILKLHSTHFAFLSTYKFDFCGVRSMHAFVVYNTQDKVISFS